MKHLLSIAELNKATIEDLLDRAETFLNDVIKKNRQLDTLRGQIVTHLFFEPSTRTQYSFTAASQRLGAIVQNPVISQTSTVKGESLLDTVRTFIAMGTRLLVIRHPEENVNEWLAEEIKNSAVIVNGGDGCHQHPSQALLDLLTIRQYKKKFAEIKVVIIGDIFHSRVARSLIPALQLMGCQDIGLIGPKEFLPAGNEFPEVKIYHSMNEGLQNADVIVSLRIQRERMQTVMLPDSNEFFSHYGLTSQRLTLAKPDAIVMHPGPMNLGTEIESSVAYGPQSVILQQVTNGVAMRMAIIEKLLGPVIN